MSNEKILKLVDVQKMSIQELLGKYNQGYVMEGCSRCGQQSEQQRGADMRNLGYRTMGRTVVSGFRTLSPATCMTSVNQGETVTISVEQTNPGTAPYVYKIYVDGALVHTSASVIQTSYTLSYTVNEAGGVSPGVSHQYGSTVTDSCPDGVQTTVLDVCAINVISVAPSCPVPTARMTIVPLVVTKYNCFGGGVCGVDPNGPYDTLEACQAVCTPVAANLVDNPGFEVVDPAVSSKPQYWVKTQNGTGAMFIYPDAGRAGTDKSVGISYTAREAGKVAIWVQDVTTIDPTRPYKLSGYMKTENVVGTGAGIMVEWYNSVGTRTGFSFAGGVRKTGTTGWSLYEGTFTPPTGTTKAKVRGDIYDASGKAWFDDMSLVKM